MSQSIWAGKARAGSGAVKRFHFADTSSSDILVDMAGATSTFADRLDYGDFAAVVGDVAAQRIEVEGMLDVQSPVAELRGEIADLRRELALRGTLMQTATLDHPKYRLRIPIALEIQRDDEGVVVSSVDFELHGVGEDVNEAIADFRRTVVQFLERLTAHEGNLGPHPASQLRRLREVIENR